MAKFRTRIKGKGKGKTWRKGQSASTNPETHKFREAAKTRFFQPLQAPSKSNLTKEAVDLFNQRQGDAESIRSEDDAASFGGVTNTYRTFDTFASDWSACSNQSYSKFTERFKLNSAMHKEMLAVLAAVTEVIKENKGTESSTEYFGAFMTALSSEDYNDDQVTAIMCLLSMGIKSVPSSILQLKFSECSSVFMSLLTKYSHSERVPLMRSIIGCLSVLLRAQESAVWNEEWTLQVLQTLLAFVSFSKPKIRKAAQHGIIVIVKNSNITPTALSRISNHCSSLVESVCHTGGITTSLHALTLLKDILHEFHKAPLKECCESILKVMTLNNVIVSSCGFQTLHNMFLQSKPGSISPKLNARLINALYDYQPSQADVQLSHAWLTLLHQALATLAKNNLALCLLNLPKAYKTCSTMLLGDKAELAAVVSLELQGITNDCLSLVNDSIPVNSKEINEIIEIHHTILSFQYHKVYNHVFQILSSLFNAAGKILSSTLAPIVKSLAQLRDSNQVVYVNELESAIGASVRTLGPQYLIRAAPLEFSVEDKSKEFMRSWILPILKDNIKHSTLKCFTDYFLPLASAAKKECDKRKEVNDQVGAISYDLLATQIWALLPSFAISPTDIVSSFPAIAKMLGGVLSSKNHFRLIVLSALRRLIAFALDENNSTKNEDTATLARFAKNFLPILFNIYTTNASGSDEEGVRLAALETIKIYLKIADQTLTKDLFDRARAKVEGADVSDFVTASVLDLIKTLLPYQSVEDLRSIYAYTADRLKENGQKKHFRILEALLASESASCKEFIASDLKLIVDLVMNSASDAAPHVKGARLRCIGELMKVSSCPEVMDSVLPEAIIFLKDHNIKTRQTAYKIVEKFICQKSDEELVEGIIPQIIAGLAGSPPVIATSLLALASVVYHKRDSIPDEIVNQIMYNVKLLAVCRTQEIVSAAMSFIKVFMSSTPREQILPYVPGWVQVMSEMADHCKRQNRTRTRDILARLIRWYGGDTILSVVPSQDLILQKRVRNLAKLHDRKQRKRAESRSGASDTTGVTTTSYRSKHQTMEEILADSSCDEMDDVEEDEAPRGKMNRKNRKKGQTWIAEDPDDIVDFTDTQTASKISSVKPMPGSGTLQLGKTKPKAKNDFKSAPDGRLIISDLADSDDEDGPGASKKKKKSALAEMEDDYEESDDDWMTTADDLIRKRPLSSIGSGPASKYQVGGSGIHRAISRASSTKSGYSSKSRKSQKSPKVQTGSEYRSKKGKGDVKRKGKPDPYAYLPLRRDTLNKRKRMKSKSEMLSILKAAKKGAAVGAAKNKSSKKK